MPPMASARRSSAAICLSRESLLGLAANLPGSRVLEGAKASGSVRRAFDAIGLTSSVVAPAGMKP